MFLRFQKDSKHRSFALSISLSIAALCLSSAGGVILGVEFDLARRACPASDVRASSWSVQSHLVPCLSLCAAAYAAANDDPTGDSGVTACAAAHFVDLDGRCGLLDSSQLALLLAGATVGGAAATGCPGRQTWLVLAKPATTSSAEPTTTTATTTAPSTTTATTTAPSTTTSTTAAPSTTSFFGATYIGCYEDKTEKRDLSRDVKTSSAMTRSMCLAFCKSKPYKYFGLQYSKECYCDMNYGNYGSKSDTDCNMRCSGDSKEICGGSARNSVYQIDS